MRERERRECLLHVFRHGLHMYTYITNVHQLDILFSETDNACLHSSPHIYKLYKAKIKPTLFC